MVASSVAAVRPLHTLEEQAAVSPDGADPTVGMIGGGATRKVHLAPPPPEPPPDLLRLWTLRTFESANFLELSWLIAKDTQSWGLFGAGGVLDGYTIGLNIDTLHKEAFYPGARPSEGVFANIRCVSEEIVRSGILQELAGG